MFYYGDPDNKQNEQWVFEQCIIRKYVVLVYLSELSEFVNPSRTWRRVNWFVSNYVGNLSRHHEFICVAVASIIYSIPDNKLRSDRRVMSVPTMAAFICFLVACLGQEPISRGTNVRLCQPYPFGVRICYHGNVWNRIVDWLAASGGGRLGGGDRPGKDNGLSIPLSIEPYAS